MDKRTQSGRRKRFDNTNPDHYDRIDSLLLTPSEIALLEQEGAQPNYEWDGAALHGGYDA